MRFSKRINQFIWVNPHLLLSFTFNGKERLTSKKATKPLRRKWQSHANVQGIGSQWKKNFREHEEHK